MLPLFKERYKQLLKPKLTYIYENYKTTSLIKILSPIKLAKFNSSRTKKS